MKNYTYKILDRIDVGGMAEVFRAREMQSGKVVAIKKILPELQHKSSFVKMFLDEAKISLRLKHPNIVQVFHLGIIDESFFIAMEYINGINLTHLLNFANKYNYRIPLDVSLYIIECIARALTYAHSKTNEQGEPLNLVHRDISPPNILIACDGTVKITDFGLVKTKEQLNHTLPGLIKGKFSYLSPEAAFADTVTQKSDLYALGIILWEMLAATPLFNHPIESEILNLVRKSEIPDVRKFNNAVDEELNQLLLSTLQRNPNQRIDSAKTFTAQIANYRKKHNLITGQEALKKIIDKLYTPPIDPIETENYPTEDSQQPQTLSTLIPIDIYDELLSTEDNADPTPESNPLLQNPNPDKQSILQNTLPFPPFNAKKFITFLKINLNFILFIIIAIIITIFLILIAR